VTNPIPHLTRASFLAEKGKKTEVFARFSVAGGSGAGDLPRDVRGFAVQLYTDEGNFDLAAIDWVRDSFGHLKVIGHTAAAHPLFAKAGLADDLDEGVIELSACASVGQYIEAAKQQRVWDREARLSESDA
jgi:hypothetical protein